jgi:hypothetical protein
MEPRGRYGWQAVANRSVPRTAQTSQTLATGCGRLPFRAWDYDFAHELPQVA